MGIGSGDIGRSMDYRPDMGISSRDIGRNMGFGGGTPSSPDASGIIRLEDLYNRPDINTAFGSRTITKGEGGRTNINLIETDFQKALREAQEGQALGMFQGGTPDFGEERKRVEEATYQRALNLIAPERERQQRETETALSLKGLPIGSEAFQEEQGRLTREQQQQLENLSLSSVLAGGQEQNRMQALRGAKLGELGNVLNSSQFLQGLTTLGFKNIDVSGIESTAFGNALTRQAFENQRRKERFEAITGAISGGISGGQGAGASGGTGGAMAGLFAASDRRLKRNIKKIGVSKEGYNIYTFKYNDKAKEVLDLNTDKLYQGVIAQEIELVKPEAVKFNKGYRAVDYSKLDVEFKEVQ